MRASLTLLAFLLTPVLEILVIVRVAGVLGGWWTLALVLGTSALGGWIVRREGRRAWRVLQEAVRRGGPGGELPGGELSGRELSESAVVLAGGLLMVAPGFVTDAVGLLLVLPFTRPAVRRALAAYGARRLRRAEARGGLFPPGMGPGMGDGLGGFGPFGARDGAGSEPTGRVVRGEVIHDVQDVPDAEDQDRHRPAQR